MKPLVYVAGPITTDPFGCVRQATQVFTALREEHLVPFCPQFSVISEMVKARSYEEWLAFDFEVIENCAAVIRLPGESPGADRECEFAKSIGLPVFHLPRDWRQLRMWVWTLREGRLDESHPTT